MQTNFDLNKEFCNLFGIPIPDKPIIPDEKTKEKAINLIMEEVNNELIPALKRGDLTSIRDGIADSLYVIYQAAAMYGINADKDYYEAHCSNMTKACSSMEEAETTKEYHEVCTGSKCVIEENNNRFIVKRLKDGKIMKSINYTPAIFED